MNIIKEVVIKAVKKGLTDRELQILAPMYKSLNGIDSLNQSLQLIFNPYDSKKNEITVGEVIYRENDKVINLVNNVDQNIFNGDIGYIRTINKTKASEFMTIDFYGNFVTLKKEDVNTIESAYPKIEAVMVGRSLIGDPGMCSKNGTTINELEAFTEELLAAYTEVFESARNAMFRMKEIWRYLLCKFKGSEKLGKQLRKATDVNEYRHITKEIFTPLPMRPKLQPDR